MTMAEQSKGRPSAEAIYDAEEARRARARRTESIARWLLPLLVVIATVLGWQWLVTANEIPHYILPGPIRVWEHLLTDGELRREALWVTLRITMMALAVAVIGGVLLAILFDQSRFAELIFYPNAVILEVTPIVGIAPLFFI